MTSPREAPVGDLARVAARTITSSIRATVGERDLSVGLVASIQTHGSLANWHPRASASFNPIDRWRTLLSREARLSFGNDAHRLAYREHQRDGRRPMPPPSEKRSPARFIPVF